MAGTTNLETILERAGNFVVLKKGDWDHEGWQEFLQSVSDLKLTLDDETKRHLGNILESSKYLYFNSNGHMKTPAKSAPKAKAKSPAKPKAKAKAAPKK